MKKLILPSIIVAALVLSGCSVVDNFIASKKADVNNAIQEQKNQLVETAKDKLDNMTTETTLNLSGKKLTAVPMSTFDNTNIEVLDVSNNLLTGALPSQIGKLKNLRILSAGSNQMTGIPAEIGQLSKLEILDLSNNDLTGLPNELGNLKNLKSFNLAGNNYSKQDLDSIKKKLPNTNFILE